MKFGVVVNWPTMNIGDDIQTYAAAKLLPRVDYEIDREHIDTFTSKNNEPVAVVMNGWWMWRKWNWPPADCIIPKLTSMHISNYTVEQRGTPISYEWAKGCGGEYLAKYGPIGCRDGSTMDFLKKAGLDCYFSGCLTLTLPQQKRTADAGTYICLVDLDSKLEKKVRELLKDTGLEIRVMSHVCDYRRWVGGGTLVKRFEKVEDILTQYQNAKCVLTRRLHVTLPCLALGTPVLSIYNTENIKNKTRWEYYKDMLRCVDTKDFLKGKYEFDICNPPANKDTYLPIREKLIQEVGDFVKEYEDCKKPIEEVRKVSYTAEEKTAWQNELMKYALDEWFEENIALLEKRTFLERELKNTSKTLKQYAAYVDMLQKEGKISKVELPEVKEPAITNYQIKKQILMDKLLKKAGKVLHKHF